MSDLTHQNEPPGELLFTNQTGAIVHCGLANELARIVARAEQLEPKLDYSSERSEQLKMSWMHENGQPIESALYAQDSAGQHQLLASIRPSDGALHFEPFRAHHFRPDIHLASYRCAASQPSKGASLISSSVQVKALLTPTSIQPEVADELVIEGNSARFKCQIPAQAQQYLEVLDWLEFPGETWHSFQSSTQTNSKLLFHSSQHVHRRHQTSDGANKSSNYFVAPNSGELHIVRVDANLNYRSFKCRAKNKLTGELVSSLNKGKLIVTGKFSPKRPERCILIN